MGADNVYIHFTGATNDQMRRVKDTGGWLSIACPIEMAMRHGMPPIQQALDAGIRPSLSSDVETTMAADMFTQMRSVFTLQRALLNERSIKGEKDLPPLLNARDVIEFATLQGAYRRLYLQGWRAKSECAVGARRLRWQDMMRLAILKSKPQ
jgi:cytosine/adenosine deaminase-related metal-dependent hydrolase